MRVATIGFVLTASTIVACQVFGQGVSANDILRQKETQVAKIYFSGLWQGIQAQNALTRKNYKIQTFCMPDDKVLETEGLIDILEATIKADPSLGSLPVQLATVISLSVAFPCTPR